MINGNIIEKIITHIKTIYTINIYITPNYSLENLFRSEMPANSVASLDFPQSP
jgi:hypothetical protein